MRTAVFKLCHARSLWRLRPAYGIKHLRKMWLTAFGLS